jgi:hypothetical protein
MGQVCTLLICMYKHLLIFPSLYKLIQWDPQGRSKSFLLHPGFLYRLWRNTLIIAFACFQVPTFFLIWCMCVLITEWLNSRGCCLLSKALTCLITGTNHVVAQELKNMPWRSLQSCSCLLSGSHLACPNSTPQRDCVIALLQTTRWFPRRVFFKL